MNLMQSMIQNKNWNPGTQIPAEQDLCEDCGVSRTVVRQALHELEVKGQIVSRKGKGTFVASPKISESLVQGLTGFYQDMVGRGLKPTTRVLHLRVIPCKENISQFLGIEAGSAVVDISRLRFIDELPIQLVNSFIPYSLCPQLAGVDLTDRSLYQYLEDECGLLITHGKRFLEAILASEQEAKLLQVERGAPLVMLESISYLADGLPIEYYRAVHRGDRSRFEVELVRSSDPKQFLGADCLPQSNPMIR
jgi:GntR family transcriptional regulator